MWGRLRNKDQIHQTQLLLHVGRPQTSKGLLLRNQTQCGRGNKNLQQLPVAESQPTFTKKGVVLFDFLSVKNVWNERRHF